ncbi:MAG: glycerol-3-phosphate 1-O-acyltransferase PlsY [Pseudomonadota bacterium]
MPDFETSALALLLVAALAYLLGSVPFGVVVSKLFGLPDPRSIGSGNIGATNVLRSGSKPAAVVTVLLDGAKGLVAVVLAKSFFGADAAQVAGLFAFVGHIFSLWLGFKGGKGVATFLGVLIGFSLMLGAIAAGLWLLGYAVFRISSLSALTSAVITPLAALFTGFGSTFIVLVVMSALLVWRHKENIQRLRSGTEPSVNWGKKS